MKQMRKLRPSEGKGLAQSQIPNKLQSWGLRTDPSMLGGYIHVLCNPVVSLPFKGTEGPLVSKWWFICSRRKVKLPLELTEGLSATIWDSEGMCEALGLKVSEPKYTVWWVYLICLFSVTLCPPLETQGCSPGFFLKIHIVNLVSHIFFANIYFCYWDGKATTDNT